MSYINNTGLQTLWNRLIVVLGGKADRTSVYTKAEVDYLISTVSSGSSGGGTGDVTTNTAQTISGVKTFTAAPQFMSNNGTGAVALKISYAPSGTSNFASIYKIDSTSRNLYLPRPSSTTAYMVAINGSSVTSGRIAKFADQYGSLTSGPPIVTYSLGSYGEVDDFISDFEADHEGDYSSLVSVGTVIDYVNAKLTKLVNDYGLY